jgi:hypothetical protein
MRTIDHAPQIFLHAFSGAGARPFPDLHINFLEK